MPALSAESRLRIRWLRSNDYVWWMTSSCGHYFCEKCALEQYRKTSKCFVCGKDTNGCFNRATEIINRIEKMRNDESPKSEESESNSEAGNDTD